MGGRGSREVVAVFAGGFFLFIFWHSFFLYDSLGFTGSEVMGK